MKKAHFFKSILLAAGLLALGSCESYLDELPDARTIVNTPEKVSELLVGAYPLGVHFALTETMSDNVGDKGLLDQTQDLFLKAYSWGIPTGGEEARDTPTYFWNASYKAIAQANQALASIEGMEDEFDLSEQKGEALLSRAYNHFMLVNLWSEHYNPATNASNTGIPYVTEPKEELFVDYERGTVEENYKKIEQDLLEGLSLVGTDSDHPKFHFSPISGKAFAVRFYLYTGKWDKVIQYADEILTAPAEQIRDWDELSLLSYDELQAQFSSVDYEPNILVVYAHSLYSRTFAGARFGLSDPKREELFVAGNPTGKGWAYPIYGTDEVFNIPKFREFFEFTNLSAGIGFPFTPVVLFSYDEVLLARAEAYAMQGQFGAALDDINIFLSKKTESYNVATDALTESDITSFYPYVENEYTPFYDITPKQVSFVKAISELKRREYYFEGQRWFDIKRFHISVTHEFRDQPSMTLEKNDPRRLLQIPQIAIGRGIAPNPR